MAKLEFLLLFIILMAVSPITANAQEFISSLFATKPIFIDSNDNILNAVDLGERLFIFTTYSSYDGSRTDFVGIVEVRDENGITVFLKWQSETIESLEEQSLIFNWLAEVPGHYQSRTFAITNFDNPQVMSIVETFYIEVRTAAFSGLVR